MRTACAICVFVLLLVAVSACTGDGDEGDTKIYYLDDDGADDDMADDDDDATDDDNDDDDDATDDDDTVGDDDFSDDDAIDDDATDDDDDDDNDDDNDDDDNGATCNDVADGMLNTCGLTLLDADGVQQDEGGLVAWCEVSEDLYGKTASVFWDCMGDCVFFEFCDERCFDDCLAPAAPAGGCGATVNEIYACDTVFLFEGTRYWIPELDLHETCDLFGDDWACYQVCVDSECDGSGSQGDDLLDCLNANC